MERAGDRQAAVRAVVAGVGPVGTAVALTVVLSIAYGVIAFAPLGPTGMGVGVVAGFVCAVGFGGFAGVFDGSRRLLSGPRALTALVVAVALQELLDRGVAPQTALAMAFASVLVAGVGQSLLGACRLGNLVAIVPRSVVAGFANASAALLVVGQIPFALGLADTDPVTALARAGDANADAVLVAAVTCAVAVGCACLPWRLPGALVGLLVGTGLFHVFALGGPPDTLLGTPTAPWHAMLAPGLISVPADGWWQMADVLVGAGTAIALTASFDTVLSARILDERAGGTTDVNRLLAVHGLGNVLMALVGGLPGSGSWPRSLATGDGGGAARPVALSVAILTGLAFLAFSDLIQAIPVWAAAGMLMALAVQVVDPGTVGQVRRLLAGRVGRSSLVVGDLAVGLSVVVVALAVDLIAAVGAGMAVAVLLFVIGLTRAVVRRVYTGDKVRSNMLRPVAHLALLERHGSSIAVVELAGALFFGSVDRLDRAAAGAASAGATRLILDLQRLTSVDSTGVAALDRLRANLATDGRTLALSHRAFAPWDAAAAGDRGGQPARGWLQAALQDSGVLERFEAGALFGDTDSALMAAEDDLLGALGARARPARAGSNVRVARQSGLLSGLEREQVRTLARHVRRLRVAAGTRVVCQGETGDTAYLLVAGRLDVLIEIPGTNRRRRVGTLVPGTVFGEMAMIDGSPRSATVVAVEPCSCLALDRATFDRMVVEDPLIAVQVLRNLSGQFAHRLRIANTAIAELER